MNIVYYTKYSRKGASSRLRSFQYIPLLQKRGHHIEVQSLFNDAYLDALYANKPISKSKIIKAYYRRFLSLFRLKKSDLLIIEKELFPYFFSWAERFLAYRGVKYLVDYDDAIFHNYDRHRSVIIRVLFGKKIDRVMKDAACVMAGNSYLAQRAIQAGAKNVQIVPTVIDMNRYNPIEKNREDIIRIGWIGSPSTFKYLVPLREVFVKLAQRYSIKITTVGANQSLGLGELEEQLPWSEESEIQSIQSFDIGIMPLEDSPWEKGKCSYKLIQYMGCGLPIVASPVGMNVEVVDQQINGYLAQSIVEWETTLLSLITDKEKRRQMGRNGRRKVDENYSLEKMVEKINSLINEK